ncbi:MAG TPA: hypothetical protein VD969_25740 [Symbiobacteriaceae bacterium]|nr:hypothetical protein [Symbiobacteriaceae bacterium]
MEIMTMLDRLEDAIAQATKVPLTGRVLLDPDELLGLVDEMRELLPQEIRDANRVARDRDAILSEAREQAETTVREAQSLAARLTAEHSVAQEAQKQAEELIDQAKRVAREIRQNALEWADELFGRVQPDLEKIAVDTQKTVMAVRKAREELQQQL